MPRNMSSASLARHNCHCGKSFARKEHLTRHQATHDEPNFVCDVCQRRFSRRELLRRHLVLHDPRNKRSKVSCDACRANKTKCSGGPPCSLCVRRSIACISRSNFDRHETPLTEDESAPLDAYDEDTASLPGRMQPSPSIGIQQQTEATVHKHSWLQDISIVPEGAVSSTRTEPLPPGLETILKLLLANETSLEAAGQDSDKMQEWLAISLETYFDDFHLRWPILNAPSFDVATAILPLVASIGIIGICLGHSARRSEKLHALQVHDALVELLLQRLIQPDSIPMGQKWPIELLEAVLLALVFSLYRNDEIATARAMLLRSTFITVLREKRMFNAEVLSDHLRTHFTGTFAPYTISMREMFRRLLCLTYQFDAYFALAHRIPPMFHYQEIEIPLAMTFGLWNSHGLDVFAKRIQEEPADRGTALVSTIANGSNSSPPSQFLVEDVILGLCGNLQSIWTFARSKISRMNGDYHTTSQVLLLVDNLDRWKAELDRISALNDPVNINESISGDLLSAYRGKDDSLIAAAARIADLFQDAMILYYFLKMWHCAETGPSQISGAKIQSNSRNGNIFQATRNEREVLLCAARLLKIAQLSGRTLNPLVKYALATGADLTKNLLTSYDKCYCFTRPNQYAPGPDTQLSIALDEPISINDKVLCVHNLQYWSASFERAIDEQNIMGGSADATTTS